MDKHKRQYVVDESGKRVAVVLDIVDYESVLSDLEELEEIRAYDEAILAGESPVPLEPELDRIRRQKR